MSKSIATFLIFVIVVAGFVATYLVFKNYNNGQIACTMDAKICPDGTAVGRVGPSCNFAPCPDPTKNWQTYKDVENKFELKYPEVTFSDNNAPFSFAVDCAEVNFPAQCPSSSDIQAKMRDYNPSTQALNFVPAAVENTVNFCVAENADGAAGTTYKTYFYLTVKESKCVITKIVVPYPNCQNYLPLEEGNIEQEKNYNNCVKSNSEKPYLLNLVFSTFKFTK